MASPQKGSPARPRIDTLIATITAAGSNDASRGAAFGMARATAQKIRARDVSKMVDIIARQPLLCAALLRDALVNSPLLDWPAYTALEEQMTEIGRQLEQYADEISAATFEAAAQIVQPV